MIKDTIASAVAGMVLKAEAININLKKPYTWSSGWNSPIYCDNRLTLSYPETRDFIKEALAQRIEENFPDVEAIAGVATAGIPQGALVADVLGLPFIYVRAKPKGHGLENMIEGKIVKKQKVVLIEDLVSTGGSSLKAAEALKAQKIEVLGMAAIFTYGFDIAAENFQQAGIKLVTLSNYASMLPVAIEQKIIQEKDLIELKSWRVDPESWRK
jgi:orotate phosphoribosyltransferase